MDPGSTPSRILGCQGADEIAKLRGDFRSAAATARKEAPVPAETSAMPAHDGLRLHDHQHVRSFRPATPEALPEEAIAKHQPRSGVLALEDSDLLPEGDELQSQVMSRAQEGTEPREKTQKKPNHRPSLHESVGEGRFVQFADFAKKWDFDDPHGSGRLRGSRPGPEPVLRAAAVGDIGCPPGIDCTEQDEHCDSNQRVVSRSYTNALTPADFCKFRTSFA